MNTRILITVVLGVGALVLGAQSALADVGPPANVGSPKHADFWNYESGIKVTNTSPGVLPQDLAALVAGPEGGSSDSQPLVDRIAGRNGALDSALVSGSASSTNTSGRDIEWPEVGIGLGIGILLVLGLGLIMRVAHVRPFAH